CESYAGPRDRMRAAVPGLYRPESSLCTGHSQTSRGYCPVVSHGVAVRAQRDGAVEGGQRIAPPPGVVVRAAEVLVVRPEIAVERSLRLEPCDGTIAVSACVAGVSVREQLLRSEHECAALRPVRAWRERRGRGKRAVDGRRIPFAGEGAHGQLERH